MSCETFYGNLTSTNIFIYNLHEMAVFDILASSVGISHMISEFYICRKVWRDAMPSSTSKHNYLHLSDINIIYYI